MSKGSMTISNKRFYVTIETAAESFEVPVYAASLDEALDEAELKYIPAGFAVTRVRPEVINTTH